MQFRVCRPPTKFYFRSAVIFSIIRPWKCSDAFSNKPELMDNLANSLQWDSFVRYFSFTFFPALCTTVAWQSHFNLIDRRSLFRWIIPISRHRLRGICCRFSVDQCCDFQMGTMHKLVDYWAPADFEGFCFNLVLIAMDCISDNHFPKRKKKRKIVPLFFHP